MNNYQNAIQLGYQQGLGNTGNSLLGSVSGGPDGWQPMSTAPRDGTVIEIRCTYGVAPWYDLFRWSDGTETFEQDGKTYTMTLAPRWQGAREPNKGIGDEGAYFTWRHTNQSAQSYIDPTGGAQDDPAYWRAAAAASIGRPADYFDPKAPSFLARIMRALTGA